MNYEKLIFNRTFSILLKYKQRRIDNFKGRRKGWRIMHMRRLGWWK